MAISLAEFKQAFAGKAGDGLAARGKQVSAALKQLQRAVEQGRPGEAADGPRRALKVLVKRYKSAKDQARQGGTGADTEMDDILRKTRTVMAMLEEAPAGGGPLADSGAAPPPEASPTRPASKPQSRKRKMRTGVVIVPNFDTVRSGLEGWAARNISRSRATYIVNLSNAREVHQDASVLELFGAEILAEVQTGTDGAQSVQFSWDPKFQGPDPNKYWEPSEGKVAAIVEVIDGKTGAPIKSAKVRFNGGQPFLTDAKGRARMEASPDSTWNVEVAAPGYRNTVQSVIVRDRPQEYPIRLTPIDLKTVDKVVMGITVVDLTTAAKVVKAKVTIGKQTLLTDVDGFVNFYLHPGVYPFTVTASGFVKETGSLDVPESKEQEFHIISLRPSGADDVFVRVVDADTDSPISKVAVRLGAQHEHTDSHGEVRFGGIPFGEHRLWARIDGYDTHDSTVVHNKGSAVDVKVVKLKSK